jgi:hypothetical protein
MSTSWRADGMTEATDATTGPAEGGTTVSRAMRATASILGAYRAFIAHTQACEKCRTEGVDCGDAGRLRQLWRDAKAAH